ncbi:hypothetical protein K493DRAFT_319008 [Basidiobolus meristosporus CBS 931.73]|uniref:Cyclin N-terminal domain-containing protein n=1 Tax=Basidiobolus meristosporus CBS 931.73 TaxID=1314790 RepID=A0A1Y1XTL8_9FUNG|nr:hypothetical protein K493DRAFT_319008 [Basidiobolus meristosporus CBS 931.73]|eukprot:ORX89053.1 hypothetical protein K493DRAFT_319008 [Basidiobolus meristosporus CBS 931.73]
MELKQKSIARSIDRKNEFLDLAIDFAVLTLHSICSEPNNPLSLKKFIRQMVLYSGTTYSTLLTSILYLFRLNSMKNEFNYLTHFRTNHPAAPAISRAARVFLASLITAHKYLHDRTTSTKAWSKLSNVPIVLLKTDEIEFLKTIKFQLFVTTCTFEKWSILLRNTVTSRPTPIVPAPVQPSHSHPPLTKLTKAHVSFHPYLRAPKQDYYEKVPSLY